MTELNFERNILIKGKIVCKTGLHVGGVAETTEIGGTDNPVIIDRLKKVPLIPGSSLKGKIRSLIELEKGLYEKGGRVCNYWTDKDIKKLEEKIEKEQDEKKKKELGDELKHVKEVLSSKRELCILFGKGASEEAETGPTRLIVRDAFPTGDTVEEWGKNEDLVHGTEIKGENWINRITSQADPRFIERVPAGSEFDFEMIYSIYQEEDFERLKILFEGMCLLEDNYLGGSGSRGYGQVRFKDLEFKQKSKEEYQKGDGWQVVGNTDKLKTPKEYINLVRITKIWG